MINNIAGNQKKKLVGPIVLLLILTLLCHRAFCQDEDFNILNKWIKWNNHGNLLISHLNDQAFHYLDLRSNEISVLKNEIDWIKRQEKVKASLMKSLGPFPEKTSLNPIITGILKKNGYKVEKIVYESIPKFYVLCL